MLTIIGAHSFHGPVRDGKGWVREAIAAKQRGWSVGVSQQTATGEGAKEMLRIYAVLDCCDRSVLQILRAP